MTKPPLGNNPEFLRKDQYLNGKHLNARILLHKLCSTASQSWEDFIFSHLPQGENLRILEFGCGPAAQWRSLQNQVSASWQITLSDFSIGMLREAQSAIRADTQKPQNGPHFDFVCQDASYPAFARDSFDFIIANHMLYHLPRPEDAIARMATLLHPQGQLMAATNGPHHMLELDELLHEFDPAYVAQSARMSSLFDLSNGAPRIARHFSHLQTRIYPCDLRVRDAELLTNYAFSEPAVQQTIPASRKGELLAFFQDRIARDGEIYIHKETGIFLASDPLK